MIDFHTHILHNIDDGAKSLKKAVKMLEGAYEKGTEVVVLTPHYYPTDNDYLQEYLCNRKKRFEELKKACSGRNVPELRLGAEANVLTDFSHFDNVHELCIENTDYMLIEMPVTSWHDGIFECIHNLKLQGIKPIIAHIDRYLKVSKSNLELLDELRPIYQINAESLRTYKQRKNIRELFFTDRVHILGSDMHDFERRKNTLPEGYERLRKNFGEAYVSFVEENSERILENKSVNKEAMLPYISKTKLLF